MNQSTQSNIEIAKNFSWLGRSGIKVIDGVRVAFLSGIDSDILGSEIINADFDQSYLGNYFVKKDVENIISQFRVDPTPVDILITCQWPLNISGSLSDPNGDTAQQKNEFYQSSE